MRNLRPLQSSPHSFEVPSAEYNAGKTVAIFFKGPFRTPQHPDPGVIGRRIGVTAAPGVALDKLVINVASRSVEKSTVVRRKGQSSVAASSVIVRQIVENKNPLFAGKSV